MRSSKTNSEGRRLTTETQKHSLGTAKGNKLCLCVSVVNPHLRHTQRQGLRMALFIQQVLVCTASLFFSLSCAHVAPSANNANNAALASPDAPLLSEAEPIALAPEDQTEDALNTVRRADEEARA